MRSRAVISVLGLGAAVAVVVASLGLVGGFRLNATPSYPLGLWRIERPDGPIKIGDLVFICMPAGAGLTLGLERGYLRAGLCPGGAGPLIKTVAALPGQYVEVGRSVTIDGSPLDHSHVRRVDAEGRSLAVHGGGIIPLGHLYLHSDYAGSYDSRYFGPLPEAGLLGLARPVATFDP